MSEVQTQFEAAAASIKEWNPSKSPVSETTVVRRMKLISLEQR